MKVKRTLFAPSFKFIILIFFMLLISLVSCISVASAAGFVSVNGTEFYLNGKPFYFGGANNYYLRYGDPNCIAYDKNGGCTREVLDDAAKMGLRVIRTWGFTDGYYYWGSLQPSMGVYDDKVFQQMDLLIKEADERDIKLMIPLVNNWPEYGGMCQYVSWCNITDYCDPNVASSSHDQFYTNSCTRNAFKNYINYVLNRKNSLTGIKYKDDPTIFAWELANEPRAKSDSIGNVLDNWIVEMSSYIKSIDSNHLVTTGIEGFYINQSAAGSGTEGTDFLRNHNHSAIDFSTFHLYPDYWGLSKAGSLQWIEQRVNDSHNILGKPVVLGEFGKQGALKNDYMAAWYNLLESEKVNGNLFWHLVDHNYIWDDGFPINYPENASTASLIMNDSAYWETYNGFLSPSNHAPQISSIADITVNEGDLVVIDVSATDADGDYIFYSIDDAYHFNKTGSRFVWQTFAGLDRGEYDITVKASDGISWVTETIYVTVNPVSGCLRPVDKLPITRNVTLCSGSYYLPNGITVADKVVLDCNGAELYGDYNRNWGITISGSNITVKNCKIRSYMQCIQLLQAKNVQLTNNEFPEQCYHGINIRESQGTKVITNIFTYNYDVGLYAYHSTGTFVSQNKFVNNGKGIYWDQGLLSTIESNNFTSNNGGAIWLLSGSNNNNITNNIMASNGLSWSQGGGVNLYASNYNVIRGNVISGNYQALLTSTSTENEVYNNTIKNNFYGLWLVYANNNLLYHNNIVTNTNYQARDENGMNSWDYNGQGNYWSNYDTPAEGCTDSNSDGICDLPYLFENNTKDNYPFKSQNGWNAYNGTSGMLPIVIITSPTSASAYSSSTSSVFNISGSVSGGTGGINRIVLRTNIGETKNCSLIGSSWICENVELLSGANILAVTAYDNNGSSSSDIITITFTSAYPQLDEAAMRAGMAIQEINMNDNLVPGSTITARWKILSYYPLLSSMRATFPANQSANINGRLVGVEPGRWKIYDRNSKVFVFEANWTVPQIPGDARIRFPAALTDGYAYMNANIPGGVDSRPYLTDGKEVLRTITSGGTNQGLYTENTTIVPPYFDTLDKSILRAGGTITRIDMPDNLAHGSVVRIRYDVLSYVPLLSRFKVKTNSGADIQAETSLINVTDGRWSIYTYKSKVYTFEYNWTVPNDPGDARIRFMNAQSDGYAYMNGNIPGGVDSRPYLTDGKEVLRTIV